VDRQSAVLALPGETLTYEHQIHVGETHRGMCRFASAEHKTYMDFVQSVKSILTGGDGDDVQNEFYVVPHPVNTHFTGRQDIRQRLFNDLIRDRRMNSKEQQRYVLYGLGGSGKTQVCLKFVEDHRHRYEKIHRLSLLDSRNTRCLNISGDEREV